jgi:hypothetical protein
MMTKGIVKEGTRTKTKTRGREGNIASSMERTKGI